MGYLHTFTSYCDALTEAEPDAFAFFSLNPDAMVYLHTFTSYCDALTEAEPDTGSDGSTLRLLV
jgi:hypothetical protein